MVRPTKEKNPGRDIESRRADRSGAIIYQWRSPDSKMARPIANLEFNFDPENDIIIEARRVGKGRGTGFFRDDSQSLNIKQAKGDPRFKNLINQWKNMLKSIIKALEKQ